MLSTAKIARIEKARIFPYPDLTRLWLRIDLSPFTSPPNLEAIIWDPQGEAISSMFLVEWRDPHISLTMHLRRPPQPGKRYTAEFILTGEGGALLDHKEVPFDLVFQEPELDHRQG
jgi:hypothetical protein